MALCFVTLPNEASAAYAKANLTFIAFQLGSAYPVGVALNYLARFVRPANLRSSVDLASDPEHDHVRKAVEAVFKIPATPDSWRYCYGIVAKHGYSVNVTLFAQLDIFCRSMMTASLLVAVWTAVVWVTGRMQLPAHYGAALVTVSGIFFLIFLFSARTYSRAFVSAIYEGFYTWHVDPAGNSATAPP